jgi:hypothetical protein
MCKRVKIQSDAVLFTYWLDSYLQPAAEEAQKENDNDYKMNQQGRKNKGRKPV